MNNLISKYEKKFGYKPTIGELYGLYTQGVLELTDEEENLLIKTFKHV